MQVAANVVQLPVGPPPLGAPITMMPNFMTPAIAQAELDARLCKVADFYGAPGIGRFKPDGSVVRIRPTDLPVLLAGHFVEVPDGKGGVQNVPAAVWWTQSPTKVVFDVVRYDPENKWVVPGEVVLNAWHGFGVQPTRGSWKRMRWHIWAVLCGYNRPAFSTWFDGWHTLSNSPERTQRRWSSCSPPLRGLASRASATGCCAFSVTMELRSQIRKRHSDSSTKA